MNFIESFADSIFKDYMLSGASEKSKKQIIELLDAIIDLIVSDGENKDVKEIINKYNYVCDIKFEIEFKQLDKINPKKNIIMNIICSFLGACYTYKKYFYNMKVSFRTISITLLTVTSMSFVTLLEEKYPKFEQYGYCISELSMDFLFTHKKFDRVSDDSNSSNKIINKDVIEI